MMKAAPAASLEVAKAEFLLEVVIVTLGAPAQFGPINQAGKADRLRQHRQPVLRRLLLALGSFDQQPFFRPRFAVPLGRRPPVVNAIC